ncbi:MAG: hypothetical protein WC337_03590 [Candidatus Muiribacteriota bacterium]
MSRINELENLKNIILIGKHICLSLIEKSELQYASKINFYINLLELYSNLLNEPNLKVKTYDRFKIKDTLDNLYTLFLICEKKNRISKIHFIDYKKIYEEINLERLVINE